MNRIAAVACSVVLAFCLAISAPPEAAGQLLPNGFAYDSVVGGPYTGEPTGFAFLPDGRIVIVERNGGAVRLAAAGASTSSVILTIPNVESGFGEQGLLGVTVDPDWPTRPYLYFYYTHTGSVAYLTMYTASGDLTDPASTNLTLASPYHLLTDVPDVVVFHNGGTLKFGPDGMLYLALGDDLIRCLAQDLTSLTGKMLRLDVSSMPGAGTGPPLKSAITPVDNPFPGPNENEQLIFALGLRNPFRFDIDENTGDIFIGDVGATNWEEVNFLDYSNGGGDNFGWPIFEGFESPFGDSCGTGPYVDPIYVYEHDFNANAIIGGPYYESVGGSSVSLPSSYDGSYFFFEFGHNWIQRLVNDGSGWDLAPPVPGQPDPDHWAEEVDFVTDFQTGPDGALYFCRKSTGRGIYRIIRIFPTDAPTLASEANDLLVSASPNPARVEDGTMLSWSLPRSSEVSIDVLDVGGRVVRKLNATGSTGSIRWDGRTHDGSRVSAGVYLYRLHNERGETASGKVSLID